MKRPVFKKGSVPKPEENDGNNIEVDLEEREAAFQEMASELEGALPPEAESRSADTTAESQTEAAIDHEYFLRLENEVKENYDKYLRAMAELENFKKRAVRERAEILKYSGENLARDLLEIADNFQRAFAQNLPDGNEEFLKGFRLIYDRLMAILEQHQIRGESALGGMFDPNKHQALASVQTSDHPPGTIIEEFKRAYFLKDKLLRPAQVVVTAAQADAEASNNEQNSENGA